MVGNDRIEFLFVFDDISMVLEGRLDRCQNQAQTHTRMTCFVWGKYDKIMVEEKHVR